MKKPLPGHYFSTKNSFPALFDAFEKLGETNCSNGQRDKKTAHLLHFGAAVTSNSGGNTLSHTKPWFEIGAPKDEILRTLMLCMSTLGFTAVMAGICISWTIDIIG